MEDICVNFLDQVQFFQFNKGRCHGNQICVVSKTQTTCDFYNFYTIWKPFGCRWQIWIFFQYLKGRCHGDQFLSYRTCSLGAKVSQDLLNRFSQSLHHMVGIELQMNDTSSFFDILRDVAMATNLVAKMGQNYHPPALIALWIQNGFEYDKFAFEVVKGTIFSTFCAILMMIGPLTAKFSQGVCVAFGTRRQKWTYHTKYLSKYWPNFTNFSALVGWCMQIIKLKTKFAVVEETLLC